MGKVFSNPVFDSRMTAFPQLGLNRPRQLVPNDKGKLEWEDIPGMSSGLYFRGSIVMDNDLNPGGRKTTEDTYRVDFLFNPSTITVSHESGAMLTADQRATDGQYVSATGIGQVSFSLLFDRTYEVLYRTGPRTAGARNSATSEGVMADVKALYRVTGVHDVTAKGAKAAAINPMQSTPCYFFFGALDDVPLTYYGYVSQMAVQYTHFTRDMIPQRCAVNLTVELTQKGAE